MDADFKQQVKKYLDAYKKRKRRIIVACVLSACTILSVYGALLRPAISQETDSGMTLSASPSETTVGNALTLCIAAKAKDSQPETYFLIATKSTGAGVVGLDFKDDVAVVPTVNNTAVNVTTVNNTTVNSSSVPSVELHRIVKNGNASYWFVLEKGANAEFQLKCIANAPKLEDTTTPAALSATIADASSATISETTASAVSSVVTGVSSGKASHFSKMKRVTMLAAASASSTSSEASSSDTSSDIVLNNSSDTASDEESGTASSATGNGEQTLTAVPASAGTLAELLSSTANYSSSKAKTLLYSGAAGQYPGLDMNGFKQLGSGLTYSQNTMKNAYTTDQKYAAYYNKDCLFGVAGNFGVVAFNTATINTHCNSNILANTLLAGANFGTNNINELSYIQHYNKINSDSESQSSNLLVVGSDMHVFLMDNGNHFGMNNASAKYDSTQIDKPNNICKDKDTANAPFIDLNEVHDEVVGIAGALNGMKDNAVLNTAKNTSSAVLVVPTFSSDSQNVILQDQNAVGVWHLTASDFENFNGSGKNLTFSGLQNAAGIKGSVIVNVDCKNQDVTMPNCGIEGIGYNETTQFINNKIVWNFTNCKGKTINLNRMFGTVIAPDATIIANQNLNGTMIGNDVQIAGENHRDDFVGKLTDGVTVLKQWKDENGSLLTSKDLRDGAYVNVYLTDSSGNYYYYDDNGAIVKTNDKSKALVKITAAQNWTYSWQNLPKLSDGDKYTIVEDSYYDGEGNSYQNEIIDKSGFITLINTPTKEKGYTLPSTGGGGTAPYTIGGLLLLAAALWLTVKAKRGSARFTPEHKKTVYFNPKSFLEKEGVINMKLMKKLVSALLTVAMVATFPLVASAASTGTNSIQIDGKEANHTYEAYQVLNGTLSGGKLVNVGWGSGVDGTKLLAAVKADSAVSSTFAKATDAASFAQAMATLANSSDGANAVAADISKSLTTVTATSTASGTTYTISGLADGYYFVKDKDASVGKDGSYTKFIMNVTGGGTSKVVPKTDKPTVAKKVMENDAAYNDSVKNAYHDAADWNIGDAVPFQIAGTVPDMSNYNTYTYTFTDTATNLSIQENTMKVYWVDKSAGASANDVAQLTTMTKTEITSGFTKAMAADNHGFTLTFDDLKATLANTTNAGYIVVDYKATLDSSAVIATDGNLKGNPNAVNLTYSNNPNGSGTGKTPDDTVVVFTYKIPVQKMDGTTGKTLATAQFALYKTEADAKAAINSKNAGSNAITFTSTADGSYTYSSNGTVNVLKSDANGNYDIKGLDEGTYYLAEISVPDGYNVPADAVKITVTPTFSKYYADGYLDDISTSQLTALAVNNGTKVVVTNNQGSQLPTTGGMGTVIFTVLGIVLMAGAAIVLITKKRISNKTN